MIARRNQRERSTVRVAVSALVASLLVPVFALASQVPAAAAACTQNQVSTGKWPGDAGYAVAAWSAVKLLNNTDWTDAENDGNGWNGKPEIDVASDAVDAASTSADQTGSGPSGFWAVDTGATGGSMVYYRVRLQSDPRQSNPNNALLKAYNWQGVIALGTSAKVIVGVIGGGSNSTDTVYAGIYGNNSGAVCTVYTSTSNDLTDSNADAAKDATPWYRVVATGSKGQYFLDLAVPFDVITEIDANVTATSATKLIFATSTSANEHSITADNDGFDFSSISAAAISGTAAAGRTVTYSCNGGGGAAPTQAAVNEGDSFTLASGAGNTCTAPGGQTFVGWKIGGTTYAAGASYTVGATNVTVNAVWGYTITVSDVTNATVTDNDTFASFNCAAGTCTGNFEATTTPTITVTPNAGYAATSLTPTLAADANGNACASATSCVLTALDSNVTLTFVSAATSRTVTFNSNGGSGTMADQTANAATNLTANAFTKYCSSFSHWTTNQDGTGTRYDNSAQYPFTSSETLYAQWVGACFAPSVFTLTVSSTTGGTVSPGTGTYTSGTAVTLTATASANFVFSGWSGDCTGTSTTCVVTMNGDKTVSAVFTRSAYDLAVTATGQGTVAPASGSYAAGSTVQLAAQPRTGWKFSNWTGACSGTTATCAVVMNSDKAVGGIFVEETEAGTTTSAKFPITVSVTGLGVVQVSPGQPAGGYTKDSLVKLTAAPRTGWSLDAWGGACAGSNEFCILTMDAAKTVQATFKATAVPEDVSAAWMQPQADGTSLISWMEASGATQYIVEIMGKKLCTSRETTCSIGRLVGPNDQLYVVATNAVGRADTPRLATFVPSTATLQLFTVNFGSGSAALTDKAKATLRTAVARVKSLGYTELTLYGHTDSRESRAAALSLARARAVAAFVDRSLDVTFVTIGKGSTSPLTSNATVQGRAANRRVVGWVK